MKKYSDWAPSSHDVRGMNMPEHQDWLVAPCGTNRDADCLTRANWEAQLEALEGTAGEYIVAGFNHWACGWFDIALVKPGTPAAEIADRLESKLADYPVLDENAYSNLQFQNAEEQWEHSSLEERVRLCQQARCSVFAARRDSIPMPVFDRLAETL